MAISVILPSYRRIDRLAVMDSDMVLTLTFVLIVLVLDLIMYARERNELDGLKSRNKQLEKYVFANVVAVLFDRDGRILLLKKHDQTWCLPGGKMEHHDRCSGDAIVREIQEELSIDETIRLASVGDFVTAWTRSDPSKPTRHYLTVVYVGCIDTTDIKPKEDEVFELASWFRLDEVIDSSIKMYLNVRPAIQTAVSALPHLHVIMKGRGLDDCARPPSCSTPDGSAGSEAESQ